MKKKAAAERNRTKEFEKNNRFIYKATFPGRALREAWGKVVKRQ